MAININEREYNEAIYGVPGKYRRIVDSVPFKTYQKVLELGWATASATVGKKLAKKLGCGQRGQTIGAITGAVAFCALNAKAEKLGKDLGITNEAWADTMDAMVEGYRDDEAQEA